MAFNLWWPNFVWTTQPFVTKHGINHSTFCNHTWRDSVWQWARVPCKTNGLFLFRSVMLVTVFSVLTVVLQVCLSVCVAYVRCCVVVISVVRTCTIVCHWLVGSWHGLVGLCATDGLAGLCVTDGLAGLCVTDGLAGLCHGFVGPYALWGLQYFETNTVQR